MHTLDGVSTPSDDLRQHLKEWMIEQGMTPFRLKIVKNTILFNTGLLGETSVEAQIKNVDHAFWFKIRWGTDSALLKRRLEECRSRMVKFMDHGARADRIISIKPDPNARVYADEWFDMGALAPPAKPGRVMFPLADRSGFLSVTRSAARQITEFATRVGKRRVVVLDSLPSISPRRPGRRGG